jgi:hypothetical protein
MTLRAFVTEARRVANSANGESAADEKSGACDGYATSPHVALHT